MYDINECNSVAVIGIGLRAPSGNLERSISKPNQLYDALLNGLDGIVPTSERWSDNYNLNGDITSKYAGLLSLDEIKSFDPIFFAINPNDVNSIDPQQRLLLKCTWEALEDSGIDPISLRGSNTSTFIGSSTVDYCNLQRSPFETQANIFGSSTHSVANRISYCYDFRGESITIDTACSSSLNAINYGYLSIKSGNSNVSIVGGVNMILDPHISKSFSSLNLLSPTGKCHTFSSNADGYVRSESVGVIVLKNLNQAIQDGNNIYCVIKGSSSNVDGNHDKLNFYSPSKSSQSENIKMAIKSTNSITASDIDYCECHGTGTPTGDPIELEGISRIFKTNSKKLLIGSIKSNIGHTEACSGAMSLIKCCLMFKYRQFLPNINFKNPNPSIKFNEWNLSVVTQSIPFNDNKKTIMAINNFGVTGSNACLILSEYNNNNNNNSFNSNNSNSSNNNSNQKYLIPICSNSSTSLDTYKSIIINQSNSIDFNSFVYNQIKFKSNSLIQKSVIVASNWDEFKDPKNEIKSKSSLLSNITVEKRKPNINVIVLCGQGSQYNQMALSLYENEPVFRESVDRFDKELFKYYGYSVLEKLRSIGDKDMISIHEPILAQPANVMIQVSLYELYTKHWGIKPDIIVGHSLGEVTSPYCSHMISFETLCYLTYHRSVAQNRTTGTGRMLSINISPEEYMKNYASKYPSLEFACYNSPSSIVIAGKEDLLNEISADLKSKDIFCAMLGSLSSFHTSSQLMIKDEVCALDIKSSLPKIPVFSTVTTRQFDSDTRFNSNYVFENIIKPVYFTQTISNIYQYIESNDMGNEITFIEIAPHPTLQYYLNQMKSTQSSYFNKGQNITVYSPLHKKKNDYAEVLKTISSLYVYNNFNVNFKSQLNHLNNKPIINNLPIYQWDDKSYFKLNSAIEKIKNDGPSIQNLGTTIDSPITSYQTFIDIKKLPFQYLKGHQVQDKYYFPGAGWVNNLLSIYSNQDLTISSIEFKSPLVLVEGINQCLQTTISSLSKNEFNVKSYFKDSKTNQWVLASLGNFSLSSHGSQSVDKINIDQLKSNCNFTKISKSEIYNAIKVRTSLAYKGLFQGVNECYVGNNCSLSLVSLKEIQNQKEFNHLVNNSSMNSLFNPAILDSCLHGLLAFVNQQVVLDRFEGFKYYSSNIPTNHSSIKELYVFSEMNTRISPFSYSGSIKIMLVDGTVLVDISNVVCTSTSHSLDYDSSKVCSPSSNEIYTPYQQSKDSIICKPESFKSLYSLDQFTVKEEDNQIIPAQELLSLFYNSINQRCPNINLQSLSAIQYDQFKQQYYRESINENLFKFVFENLKSYQQYSSGSSGINNNNNNNNNNSINQNNNNKSGPNYYQLLDKTTKIIAKQLIPLENDDKITDTPQSLFESGFLDDFYQNSRVVQPLNDLLSEIIFETIKPIMDQSMVFRILEVGGGTGSLSILVLEKISKLLSENPSYRIDIEYTWTDISASFFAEIKERFSRFTGISILYRVLDLEKPLVGDQELKPSYYDLLIMSNVMHVVKHLKPALNEIFKVLTPNGQLMLVEPPYKSFYYDSIFGVFSQWWPSFDSDTELRGDRQCMKQAKWTQLLNECNFMDTIMSGNDNLLYLIQTRKPSIKELLEIQSPLSTKELNQFNNIILFENSNGNSNRSSSSISNLISSNQQLNSTIIKMNNYNQFKSWVNQSLNSIQGNSKTLILFLKSMDSLNIYNFKDVTLEYIQINQLILGSELSNHFKHVVLSLNSTTENYLSSSITGAARYFVEFPQLDLYSLNFDNSSINSNNNNSNNIISLVTYLINPDNNIQKEFTIKDNQVYYERYTRETNIKFKFKSKSFENDKDQLYTQLDSNLQYQLYSRKRDLKPNEVEVKVLSTGINYKDYLMYIGMISSSIDLNYGKSDELENGSLNNNPNIGNDFSGIIVNCGSQVKKLKIGDHVCGVASKTSGSHVIIDHRYVYNKPNQISFSQAASIPSVYVTSLHSIYTIGNLRDNQTILIHSGTGGVGLSALEILKWKQHKGYIFATVGSQDKENYLKDTYGSFITGIYSSKDRSYVSKIKNKLRELGNDCENQGVDLVLNTLSSEYMEANFKCLNQNGRICDLSITHLTPNDYMINNLFKYNFGYSNVELVEFSGPLFRRYLKKIVRMIESNKLQLIPIIEYSNDQFSDAVQYINERQHIGKIIVNHDQNLFNKLVESYQTNNQIIMKQTYDISRLDIGKNILVTGQSGIILEILKYLVKYSNQSIENIIVLSKSKLKWELELLMNQTRQQKGNIIKFHYYQVDIESGSEIKRVLDELQFGQSNISNVDSIIHFAFMNDIGDVFKVDMDRLNNAHGAKTMGAINLHQESINRSWNIKQFIMASSVVSIFGSDQQCCYVSACSTIDALSKYRNSIGLPSLSINLGAISQTGFVSRNDAISTMFRSSILKLFSPQLIISSLDLFIQNSKDFSTYCLSDFDFENLPSNLTNYHLSKLDYQINLTKKSYSSKSSNNNGVNSGENIKSTVLNKISELLSVDESKINLDLQLSNYGMDSLVLVNLKNWVDNQYGVKNLITIQQLQNNKISQFIEIIIKEYNNQNKSKLKDITSSGSKQQEQSVEEFIKNETVIDESIISRPYNISSILSKANQHSILLTGSTGFLGSYLLSDLIKMDSISKVYCLIRNKSQSIPIDEIINNLKNHQLYSEESNERPTKVALISGNISRDLKSNNNQHGLYDQLLSKIIPIVGDISKERFGISLDNYTTISNECDIIINSAADLNLQSDYNESKSVNVNGVKELIKFSTSNSNQQKLIVHFTSLAVFVDHKINQGQEYDEQLILPKFENTSIGYMQSKIISETLLRNAAESRGIPSIIIRPPDIWANPTTGIGHSNDIISLTILCSSIIGYYPDLQKNIFTTPVTTISKNSINLIFNEKSWHQDKSKPFSIYSLNGDSIEMKSLYRVLETNYNCKQIDFKKWKELVANNPSKPCQRYSTFHNLNHSFISNAQIPKEFKMSSSTKDLLKSINSYNETEWSINDSMIINNINHYINK